MLIVLAVFLFVEYFPFSTCVLSCLGEEALRLSGRGKVDCGCVWTVTVTARFDVARSNCLSCEHK